jgi:hypothetical protein
MTIRGSCVPLRPKEQFHHWSTQEPVAFQPRRSTPKLELFSPVEVQRHPLEKGQKRDSRRVDAIDDPESHYSGYSSDLRAQHAG